MLLPLLLCSVFGAQSAVLKNPDFESPVQPGQSPPGWNIDVGATNDAYEPISGIEIDTQIKHGGKASIRMSGDESTRAWRVLKQDVPVRLGGMYKLTGFARTRGVRREYVRGTRTQQFDNCYIGIVFTDWNGEVIAVSNLSPTLTNTDWEELSMYYVAPEKARRAQVAIFLSMTGTLWVDDLEFSLEGGTEPPATKFLMTEGFEDRDELPPEWSREIGARVGTGTKTTLVQIDPNEGAVGSPRSLKLSNDETTNQFLGFSRRFACEPGDGMRYRSWVKYKDVRKDGTQPHNFYTGLVFVDASNKLIGAKRYAYGELGTSDWTLFEVTGVAPEGAVGVLAGIFLSLSGDVWLDRLELTSQAGATPEYAGWEKLDSDHVTLRYPPDHPDRARFEYYGTRLDNAFETVHKRLGMPYGDRITMYLYTDSDQGQKMTSRVLDFSNPQGRVVHQRYESMPGHELTHVIAFALGTPGSDLFNEGLAVYFDGTPPKELHQKAAAFLRDHRMPPLSELLEHFHAGPEYFAAAGSFVGYVLDTLGPDLFKKLYLLHDPDQNAATVVPGGFADLEKKWREFLKQQP